MGAVLMLIEKKRTAELLPAEYNPRKDLRPGDAEYEKLKRSIEQFGYVEPVIWNKTTGRVVGGHQRLKVLLDMGMTEVDCVVVELDAEKEKALNIALNKISGEWDKEKLALLISDLQGADFDVSLTGFEPDEIDALFKDSIKDGIKDDDFDVDAELQKPAIAKQGDLWLLGRHRLVCGDSTKAETFSLLMADKRANLVVTDPPYNVNYEGTAGKIKNDNMAGDAFYTFLFDAFSCMAGVMADDASIYVFHADTEGLNFRKAFSDAGFYLSGTCIWKKQSLVLGRSPYQWQHEPVLFGWKKKGKHLWYTGRKESTIWEFDKPKKNGDHPTMKPVPLLAYPIMNSSMSNAIVLDPFGGSGSTLIACEQTERVCHTIELDEKFCDVIVKRYIEQVGSSQGVSVQRDGLTYGFDELSVQTEDEAIPLF
jgi:DNA modification methylase